MFGEGLGDVRVFFFGDGATSVFFFFFDGVGVFLAVARFFFWGFAFGFGVGDLAGLGELLATVSGVSAAEVWA